MPLSDKIHIAQLHNPVSRKNITQEAKSDHWLITAAITAIILFLIYAVISTVQHVETSEL
jgi:hypothetical protein